MADGVHTLGRINLRHAAVLLLDANPQALDVMRQIVTGFGVRSVHATDSPRDARELCRAHTLELMVVDPLFTDDSGFEFIRWIRREEDSANRCVPIIAAMGHQTLINVRAARDAGANLVVAKPLSPDVLLRRIAWVAREHRPFVAAPGYVGPDRRFKNEGPPPGMTGRRGDDLSIDVPDVTAPNMSQSEVDDLFKPRKVVL